MYEETSTHPLSQPVPDLQVVLRGLVTRVVHVGQLGAGLCGDHLRQVTHARGFSHLAG